MTLKKLICQEYFSLNLLETSLERSETIDLEVNGNDWKKNIPTRKHKGKNYIWVLEKILRGNPKFKLNISEKRESSTSSDKISKYREFEE